MKTKFFFNYTKIVIAVFFSILSFNSFSQSVSITLKNITQLDAKNLTFEIWLENTWGGNLTLEGIQAGINFNYSGLANGGTISGEFVPGTADPTLQANQQTPLIDINETSKQIRIAPAVAQDQSSSTLIPGAGGFRIGRIKITNTVNFAPVTPNFAWSFLTGDGYTTATVVVCYVNGNIQGTDLTVPANITVTGNPAIVGAAVPTLSEWGLIIMTILLLTLGAYYIKR